MSLAIPGPINPVATPGPLLLNQTNLLVSNPYLPLEAGYGLNSDGMWHVAGHTYMRDVTGPMIDWWFGYVTTTDQYKQWHPKDHVYSSWEGPHGNSTYIDGNHLVHEYIGGDLMQLRINFKDPKDYFGSNYKSDFSKANITTAVCARVGLWEGIGHGTKSVQVGHVIHLVHNEPMGVRMRSRFWLGDLEGITDPKMRGMAVPPNMVSGLMKHTIEEMAILGTFLSNLYRAETMPTGPRRRGEKRTVPWSEGL